MASLGDQDVQINVKIASDTKPVDDAKTKLGELNGSASDLKTNFSGLGDVFKSAFGILAGVGITVGGVAMFKEWVDIAAKAKEEMIVSQVALKNVAEGMQYVTVQTGGSTASLKGQRAEIQGHIQDLRLQVEGLRLSGKGHEGEIKSINEQIHSYKLQADALKDNTASTSTYTTVLNKHALNYDQLNEAILKVSKSTVQLGFDDEDSYAVMVKNVGKTKDVAEAQIMLNAEMEMARAKHMDLADVALLLGKAYDNGGAALARQGIAIDKHIKGMDLINAVYAKYKGTVDQTNKEDVLQRWANLNLRIEEIKQSLGDKLLPIVEKFTDQLFKLIDAAEKAKLDEKLGAGLKVLNIEFDKLAKTAKNVYEYLKKHEDQAKILAAVLATVLLPPLITLTLQFEIQTVNAIAAATLKLFLFNLESWKNVAVLLVQIVQFALATLGIDAMTLSVGLQTFALGIVNAATWLWNAGLVALTTILGSPVVAIVLLIAVIAALYYAWQNNFGGIRDITQNVINSVIDMINSAIDAINTLIKGIDSIMNKIPGMSASFQEFGKIGHVSFGSSSPVYGPQLPTITGGSYGQSNGYGGGVSPVQSSGGQSVVQNNNIYTQIDMAYVNRQLATQMRQ